MQDGGYNEPGYVKPEGGMKEGPEAVDPGVINKFGIVETLDVVDSLVKLANATKVTMEDGKFSPMEAFNFIGALTSLPKALTGLEMIPAEIGDLDNDEIMLMVDRISDTLDYVEEYQAKNIINKALIAGLAIKDLIEEIKNVS